MKDPTTAGEGRFPAILVDARGHRCPIPTLRLRRALTAAPAGALLRLLADDPLARIDVALWAAEAGVAIIAMTEECGTLTIVLRKG